MKAGRGRPRGAGAGGFTLIELLVVLAIIAVLIALVVPGLQRARWQALRTACAAQLRQVGVAITLYADDHGGMMPSRGYDDVWLPDVAGDSNLGRVWAGGYLGELYGGGRLLYCPAASPVPEYSHPYAVGLAAGGASYRRGFAANPMQTYTRITYCYRYHTRQSGGYIPKGFVPPEVRLDAYPLRYSDYGGTTLIKAWVACLQASMAAPYPMRVMTHNREGSNVLLYDGAVRWVPVQPGAGYGEPDNHHPRKIWWVGYVDEQL